MVINPRDDTGDRNTFARISESERSVALEFFADNLRDYLAKDISTRQDIMKKVGDSLKMVFDPRQFDEFLRGLYSSGYLTIGSRRLRELSQQLTERFQIRSTVVAGSSGDRFAVAAASDFVSEIWRIGAIKKEGDRADAKLSIGLVSGRTTASVIGQLEGLDWNIQFGVDPHDLPAIRVFALNVFCTNPENLPDNATVLAYRLAKTIEEQSGNPVEAYGLSAPTLVEKAALSREDQFASEVLMHTEPSRVRASESQGSNETELDIVLTGVGGMPNAGKSGGSICCSLAQQYGFDIDALARDETVVGDVAFTFIRRDGRPAPLRKGEKEYLFFSAVGIGVLEAMAKQEDKAVILVARETPGKDKIAAVFAAIGSGRAQGHRYASRLIVDEATARGLMRF